MNKKGLTIVELIASIGLLSVLFIFLLNLFVNVRSTYNNQKTLVSFDLIENNSIKKVNDDVQSFKVTKIEKQTNQIKFTFINPQNNYSFTKILKINKTSNYIEYTCTTSGCSGIYRISDFKKVLPNNYKINDITYNEYDNYYKIIVKVNNDSNNKDIDLYIDKNSNSSSDSESYGGSFLSYFENIKNNYNVDSRAIINYRPDPSDLSCTYSLAYDGTADNNLRYVGKNPCNYVTFNEETAGWRIIGIMNNVLVGGTPTTLIKLVRAESLGNYAWSNNSNNDYSSSSIKTELNNDYLTYSNTTATWTGTSYSRTKSIKSAYKDKIETATWYLGGFYNDSSGELQMQANAFYIREHDGEVPNSHSTTWSGQVALPSVSDFGFAVGGNNYIMNMCRTERLEVYDDNYYSFNTCSNYVWLDNSWTITPTYNYGDRCAYIGTRYNDKAGINRATVSNDKGIKPTIYLKANVKLVSGSGKKNDPFVIQ